MTFRFRDIPRLPSNAFTFENMIRFECGTPCYRDIASGRITVEKPWAIVGWSDQVDERLMHGREDYIAIMLFHPDRGEFWQHYPLMDQDMRDAAVFDGLLMREK
jgi:hypothetical protein